MKIGNKYPILLFNVNKIV